MASALTCSARLRRAAERGAAGLSDAARDRVGDFLCGLRGQDGGYRGRHAASDLYYSFFALASLSALAQPIDAERVTDYLHASGDGSTLDLVHLCCLARCHALLPGGQAAARSVASRLDDLIAVTGGYRPALAIESGSIAGSFVALLCHEELDRPLPADAGLAYCIATRACADGSWADVPGLATGTTTVTAAAALMRAAAGCHETAPADWLAARWAASGGFLSSASAPMPDLLSTAAALVALDALGVSRARFAGPTRRFVDNLWHDDGGFRGCAADPKSDSEFTYYALVALGALEECQP